MIVREKYEWAQIWWEEADNQTLDRILLIGDSITLGYRTFVQEILKGKFYVDMLATSKAIDDPSYIKELNYLLKEYDYKFIHFNNGLHGWHVTSSEYENRYRYIINLLKSRCSKISLATSTPVTIIGDSKKNDGKKNDILKIRNSIVVNLAKEFGFQVDDLYEDMLGKHEYRVDDGYHYNDLGKEVQGHIVAKRIFETLI